MTPKVREELGKLPPFESIQIGEKLAAMQLLFCLTLTI